MYCGDGRNLFKIMFKELSPSNHHSLNNRAVPVSASHPARFRSFMFTGICHCVRSPARKSTERCGRRTEEKRRKRQMRNEGCTAAYGLKNIYNNVRKMTSSLMSAVPVRPLQLRMLTDCIPSGSKSLSTAPAKGKAERGERIS